MDRQPSRRSSPSHVRLRRPHEDHDTESEKLDDRSCRTIFVGYEAGSKAYRLYDPSTRRVHVSRDVIFDEAAQWNWAGEIDDVCSDFVVEEPAEHLPRMVTVTTSTTPSSRGVASTSPTPTSSPSIHNVKHRTTATLAHVPEGATQFVTPPVGARDELDADHDEDAPLRFRRIDNVIGPATPLGPIERELDEHLLLASEAEPATFEEALRYENWRLAMLDEFTSIEDNNTWVWVDPPPGVRAIELKWVFRTKRDEAGLISKYKGRLVAKFYVQRQGVDFDEVFALVARLESVRLLLACAAAEGWQVHHMDVKSTFLNGELSEDVYVEQPLGL
jgi:hypothetical protein